MQAEPLDRAISFKAINNDSPKKKPFNLINNKIKYCVKKVPVQCHEKFCGLNKGKNYLPHYWPGGRA